VTYATKGTGSVLSNFFFFFKELEFRRLHLIKVTKTFKF